MEGWRGMLKMVLIYKGCKYRDSFLHFGNKRTLNCADKTESPCSQWEYVSGITIHGNKITFGESVTVSSLPVISAQPVAMETAPLNRRAL
jgi:hypothetical protein